MTVASTRYLGPLVAAALICGAAARTAAQQPTSDRTRFKAATEVVAVEVSVLDRDGRPIDNLTANDFSVIVDGRRRQITSIEYVRLTPAASAPAPSPYYSSNLAGANGRLVMLVLDQASISPGRMRATAESTSRFIKRLSPVDRVGLVVIPAPGPHINFTSNHSLIQAQLTRIAGESSPLRGLERVSIGEALRIDRGDQMALNTAADRECAGTDRQVCQQELMSEARDVVSEARTRSQDAISSLRAIVERLATNQIPKTIVYVSEALIIDHDRSDLAWLGPLAAKGRLTVHVLRIVSSVADASRPRRSSTRSEDVAAAEEGLSLVAGLTRGSLYRVDGSADDIFERLARESSAYYLLGFAPEPADRDGKPHKIKVEIPARRNIEVRARQEFALEAARQPTTEEVVAEALRAPGLLADIPLTVTAYTFPDRNGPGLRILIAAEIQRAQNDRGAMAVGYALVGPNGQVVASQFERDLKTPVREGRMQSFLATASATTAGLYGLKLAVVDETGRVGTVEHAFRAQLTAAGPARVGDLVIGESAGSIDGNATPTASGEFVHADSVQSYLELDASSPALLNDATVAFEIAAGEDTRALDSITARVQQTGSSPGRHGAQASLPTGLLPPGDYYARAIVSVGGKKSAQVVRPFRVVRSSPGRSGIVKRGGGANAGDAAFSLRIEPFERATVLARTAVTSFVERLNTPGRVPVSLEIMRLAQAGQLEAAATAAKAGNHRLAAPFLDGLSLYARNDFEAAAARFREAIQVDSEFFPAIFYLGACYAANGRDRDAAAAWQTSLVGEHDTPLIYAVLGDALLRQRAVDEAVGLLKEASERWPHDPDIQSRLGTALVMAGQSGEALDVLRRYLERERNDSERLFIVLRLIYEERASGRARRTLEDDRAKFEEYAAAYTAAGGRQTELVERWREFLKKPGF